MHRLTLARQYLLLQSLIVVVVLLGVGALTMAQGARSTEATEGRLALGAAENLAKQGLVQDRIDEHYVGDRTLAAVAETTRQVSGADFVALTDLQGLTLSSSNPMLVNERLPVDSPAMGKRAWVGVVDIDGESLVLATAPVLDRATTDVVGVAAIGRAFPSGGQRLVDAGPNLLVYLGVSSALGLLGSFLLARRVKRQTLGMEPTQIAALVEHREALLHGVKEGVIALDPQDRVTMVNDSASHLLELDSSSVGRDVHELGLEPAVLAVLTGATEGSDRLALVDDRVLSFNRMPMTLRGATIGSVTTLRDRTDLIALEEELGQSRATSNTLRAQTHEFANQLHVIKGLLRGGHTSDAERFIDGVRVSRTQFSTQVSAQVHDVAVAALIIAKVSLAAEQGVELVVHDDSSLGVLPDRLSHDVTRVVGNLLDNALDAVGGVPVRIVTLRLDDDEHVLTIQVCDSGPGVPEGDEDSIFIQGFSTKSTAAHARGFGLALVRLACRRNGGDVRVHNDGGAVFTATLMRASA